MNSEKILCKGKFAEIGQNDTEFHHKTFENKRICEDFHDVKNHDDAFNHLKDILTSKEIGVVKSMDEIAAIGHRVVHGGEYFTGPVIIDGEVIKKIESLIPLAPLHNKASISGIKSLKLQFSILLIIRIFLTMPLFTRFLMNTTKSAESENTGSTALRMNS